MTINLNIEADVLEYTLQKVQILNEAIGILSMDVKSDAFEGRYDIVTYDKKCITIDTYWNDALEVEDAVIFCDSKILGRLNFHPLDSMGGLEEQELKIQLRNILTSCNIQTT